MQMRAIAAVKTNGKFFLFLWKVIKNFMPYKAHDILSVGIDILSLEKNYLRDLRVQDLVLLIWTQMLNFENIVVVAFIPFQKRCFIFGF